MIERFKTQKQFEESYLANMYAFRGGIMGSKEDQQAYYDKCLHTDNYGVYQQGKLINQLINLPYEASVYGVKMTMGGVADILTVPTERGQGVIKQLYQELFDDYFQNKIILSYLAPFSHSFYRQYGYASGIEDQFVTVSNHDIEKLPSEKKGSFYQIDRKNKHDQERLKAIYSETNEVKHGAFVRPDYWWDFIFAYYPHRHYVIAYDESDQAVGYLMYELDPVATRFSVREWGYINSFGLKKVMTFLKNHTGNFSTFSIKSSPYNKWYLLLEEPKRFEIKLVPTLMIRIVLLKAFIQKFPFVEELTPQRLVIKVTDQDCKWNCGKWQLDVIEGKGQLSPINQEATVDINGTIEQFSQLFFNVMSLEELVSHGELDVAAETIKQFDRLIPKEKPYAYDHF